MMRSMQARVFGGAVAWIGGTVTATALSLLAVSALGHGMAFGGTQTLSSDQVARALAAATTPAASPSATPSPGARASSPAGGPPPGGKHRSAGPTPAAPAPGQSDGSGAAFASPGGTVFAQCGAGGAYLTSWSPAQGFQADQVQRGPAEHVAVRFVSGGTSVVLHVECPGGQPHAWVSHTWGDDGPDTGDH